MNDIRDPTALVRHAVQVGDWRLVELLARRLSDRFTGQTTVAHRAYGTLVGKLGLGDPDNYHRR
jgi:hypothetical protein